MDSFTQATLGAAIGEAILGKKLAWKGALTGAILATIPDLDIALKPFYSDLQNISIHRGYSHSIIFSLIGAWITTYLLSQSKWSSSVSKIRLWLFSWLTLFTHMLLDAFTTYGTQLFLPVSDMRVSFDSINIVDPVYTLPLLFGVVISIISRKYSKPNFIRANQLGLVISSLYLLFTLINKQIIESEFTHQLKQQSISFDRLLTVPVKVGNIKWYGVAKENDSLHIGNYSHFKNNIIDFHSFPINDHLLQNLDDHLVDRMKWFSKGFYTVAKANGTIRIYNMQCDMQGVREFGDYKAPTAFYFEIKPQPNGNYQLSSGMHTQGK